MPESQYSLNAKAIFAAGYLIERDNSRAGQITMRARRDGETRFSVSAASDEAACAALLAKIRQAPAPGSDAARKAAGRETLGWAPLRPPSGPKSN
jgi:hypothetical protein